MIFYLGSFFLRSEGVDVVNVGQQISKHALFNVIINNINNVYNDNNENNYIIQIIIIMITFIHSLTRPLKMILFWTTSVSPKLYKHDYMTIIILCIHCWSIHFFPFGLQYVSTIILGTSKEIHFLHWRFQCLGNNNVCSTYLDCCKLRSYVYLANLCDKLGEPDMYWTLWMFIHIIHVFVNRGHLFECYFLFVCVCFCFLFNCFIPNLEIQIVDKPFC